MLTHFFKLDPIQQPSQPEQFEPELVVRKTRKLKPINGPGIFWFLIVLVLILSGFSIGFLNKDRSGDSSNLPDQTPRLLPTIIEARQPRIYTVSYRNGVFSPTNLRIRSGDTVRFKNEGFLPIRVASDPHPDHNNLVGFDSIGDIPQGSFFSFTFAAKGIFGYHSDRDTNKNGTIIVR